MHDIKRVTDKLRGWPIDQVFTESVPCSTYRLPDGSFDHSKLIIDVWNTALDNIDIEYDKELDDIEKATRDYLREVDGGKSDVVYVTRENIESHLKK